MRTCSSSCNTFNVLVGKIPSQIRVAFSLGDVDVAAVSISGLTMSGSLLLLLKGTAPLRSLTTEASKQRNTFFCNSPQTF